MYLSRDLLLEEGALGGGDIIPKNEGNGFRGHEKWESAFGGRSCDSTFTSCLLTVQ